MKIAIVGPAHPFKGGITHYTSLLFQKLKVSHDVRYYAFCRQYPRWLFPGRISDLKDPLFQLNGEVLRVLDTYKPWTWIQTARAIREYSPELLILPWWVFFWAPVFHTLVRRVKRNSNTKVVFICHNVIPHERALFQKPIARSVLGLGDEIIVHCQQDKELIATLLPQARIHKVMHPIYDVFARGASRDQTRKKMGLQGFTLLFFGFVRPYKGLRYLLEAMPQVVVETGAHLIVAGEFWENVRKYHSLIDRLRLNKHVTLIDRYIPSEEVHDYFAAADLVVLPYVHCTGSGIVQIAFGCQRPVVASAVGSLPEAIVHGQNGLLVPPKDPLSLARTIIQFYRHGLGHCSDQMVPSYNSRFSWDHLVSRLESFGPVV